MGKEIMPPLLAVVVSDIAKPNHYTILQWIRIRIQECKNTPKIRERLRNFMF
jgi:hypothetical protein